MSPVVILLFDCVEDFVDFDDRVLEVGAFWSDSGLLLSDAESDFCFEDLLEDFFELIVE